MALNAVCLAGLLVTNLVPVTVHGRLLLRGMLAHRQRPRVARRSEPAPPPEPSLCIEYEAWDALAARAFGLMKRGDPVVLQGTLAQRRVVAGMRIITQLYVRVVRVDPLPPAGHPLHLGSAPPLPPPNQLEDRAPSTPGAPGAPSCQCSAADGRPVDEGSAPRVEPKSGRLERGIRRPPPPQPR
jgi:hypothetical protein